MMFPSIGASRMTMVVPRVPAPARGRGVIIAGRWGTWRRSVLRLRGRGEWLYTCLPIASAVSNERPEEDETAGDWWQQG